MQSISIWLVANKLKLNTTKTELMLIVSRQNCISRSEHLINQVSTSKSLGVLVDANIPWDSHIEKLAKKIASGIAAIKRVGKFVPPATLHLIYKALIQCNHISTTAMFLGENCGKKLADKLQILQKSCRAGLNFLKL